MDHKTLFPISGDGVLHLGYPMKPAKVTDYRLWQEINRQDFVKFGVDLEHIINFAGFRIISINRHLGDIWFLTGDICKIHFKFQPQHIVYPLI